MSKSLAYRTLARLRLPARKSLSMALSITLVTSLAPALVLINANSANAAATVTRSIGGGSVTWTMNDFFINEVTSAEPTGTTYAGAGHGDGYDGMHNVAVAANASQTPTGTYTQFGGTGTWNETTSLYTTAPSSINGLSVNVSHKLSATHSAGRALITLTNSSASSVSRSIRYWGNLGSDSSTQVKYTSKSSSRTPSTQTCSNYSTAVSDVYWTITSDSSSTDPAARGGDPVISYVYGTPNASAGQQFQMTCSDNLWTSWNVTVPANSTRIIMVVYGAGEINSTKNSLGGTYDGVKNHLESFDKLPADLKSDLTGEQTGQIVNWLIAPQPTTFLAGSEWHVPSASSTLDYTVEFPSAVTGLAVNDFTLGGTSTGWNLTSLTAISSSRYTLRLSATNPPDGTIFPIIRVDAVTDPNTTKSGPTQALNGATVTVDGTAPSVSSTTVPSAATYWPTQQLNFTLNFNEIVNVVGTPQLPLTIGSTTRNATYVSGSGTTALTFRYTVQASSSDIDADGIQIASTVDLNSGTIRDQAGNNFGLSHGVVNSSLTGVRVAQTPASPTITSIVSGNNSLTVNFTAGASNGATLVSYEYTTNGGTNWKARTDVVNSLNSPILITVRSDSTLNLANGTSYTVGIRATTNAVSPNNVGTPSSYQTITPSVVSTRPQSFGATANDQSIAFVWAAPANNGGASVTRYHVKRYLPPTSGLISSYQFNSSLEDVAGGNEPTTSPTITYSDDRPEGSKSATFSGGPTIKAPRTFTTDYSISLWFKTSTNGVTGAQWYNGSALIESDAAANTDDWGITLNGTVISYGATTSAGDFTIKGTSNVIDGQWHHVVVTRERSSGRANLYVDGILEATGLGPTNTLASSGELSIGRSLSDTRGFTGLLDDIRIYSAVTPESNFYTNLCNTAGTACTASSLTNGTPYTARVNATNSAGVSPWSNPVLLVTPRGVPGAPTNVVATPGTGSISVAFDAPTNTNGAVITRYRVTTTSGITVFGTSSPILLTGLTNGTSYTISVSAENVAGFGAASTAIVASPRGVPNAPTAPTLTVGNGQLLASWNAPASNGSPIIDYIIETSTNNSTWTVFNDGESTGTSATITGITNGTLYYIRVIAKNAIGNGTASSSAAAVPARTPSAPVISSAFFSGTAGRIDVSWAAPNGNWNLAEANGGNTLTDFVIEYSSNNGGTWTRFADGVSVGSSAQVTGLANGTTYIFRVAAVNARGTGDWSASSSSVIVASAPGVPTGLSATPGDGSVTLTWTAPTNTGGAAITGYRIQRWSSAGWVDAISNTGSSTTNATVTGLTNGLGYYFAVAAINPAGTGSNSSYVGPITPRGVPLAPTMGTVSAGNQQIVVTFSAPSNTGGSTITSYVATATDSNSYSRSCTWTTGALTCTITGLTNGTLYTVTVVARNSYGSSLASGSATATPRTTPAAPTFAAAGSSPAPVTASGTQIVLNWNAPTDNGGSAITDYIVQYSTNNSTWTTFNDGTSTATTATITSLTPGAIYYLRVAAVNTAGTGAYGSPQVNPTTLAGVPDAPTSVSAIAGNARATVSWVAPNNRGSAITDYIIEFSSNGGSTWTTFTDSVSTATSATVTSLANGTGYIFRISAVNGIGTGSASIASAQVVTATTPAAPTVTTSAIVGNAQLQVAFTAGSDGGSAITSYEYSLNGGLTWAATVAGTTSPVTITGLTNGTEYTIKLRAVNAVGAGTASTQNAVGTPATTPGVVSSPIAVAGNASISLSFATPANSGGAAITGYKYKIRTSAGTFGAESSNFTASPINITSLVGGGALVNGTQYVIELWAINSRGSGTVSTLTATPFTVPAAPSLPTATTGNGQLTYTVTAGSNGGSTITAYEYQICGLDTAPTTGVTLNISNGKCVLTFTSSAQAYSWKVPNGVTSVDYLAVAGGGGGGYTISATQRGGGGGAGGVLAGTAVVVPSNNISISIGAGGAGATSSAARGSNGGNTSFGGNTASGGGGGGSAQSSTNSLANGADGGSGGGGAANYNAASTGGAGSASQGNSGGAPGGCTGANLGATAACAAASAGAIKTANPSATDGNYWILINGVATNVYAIMNSTVDGGAWILAMKSKKDSSTFNYDSAYWTTTNLLTPSGESVPVPLSTNNADAKYSIFNDASTSKVMAIFRDVPTSSSPVYGGSNNGSAISGQSYGFIWAEDMPSGPRTLRNLFSGSETYVRDASNSTLWKSGSSVLFSTQCDVRFYGFNYEAEAMSTDWRKKARWGFGWNENNTSNWSSAFPCPGSVGWNSAVQNSNDAGGGIGMNTPANGPTFAVGSFQSCCTNNTAPNASYGVEIYIKSDATTAVSTSFGGAGGGGTGSVGQADGTGGSGLSNSISGSATTYGVGGGSGTGAAPAANRGSGGRASGANTTAGEAGSSGIVVVSYAARSVVVPATDLTAGALTITGLSNGNSYLVAVRAINAAGGSSYTNYSSALTPMTVPSRPQISSVVSGAGALTFNYTINNGGSPLTKVEYRVRSSSAALPDGQSCATYYNSIVWSGDYGAWGNSANFTSTTGSLTGLTLICYDVQIRAGNLVGDGLESRGSGRPLLPASAPTNLVLTPGDSRIAVAFNEPEDNGGTSIIRYEYQLGSGAWSNVASIDPNFDVNSSNSFVITGLTNGTTYHVKMRAVNTSGASSTEANGTESASASTTPVGVPSAPSLGAVVPLDSAAQVAITTPTLQQSGGLTITDYDYKVGVSGEWVRTATGNIPSGVLTISGLTNPDPRSNPETTVYVRAVNSLGVSEATSFTVKSGVIPAAPTITQLVAGDTQIQAFAAPGTDGGYPITQYTFEIAGSLNGIYTAFTSATPSYTFTSLINGDTYFVKVKATNAVGGSGYSAAQSATPATTPGAIIIGAVTVSTGAIKVKITTPTELEPNSPFTPCAQGGPCAVGDVGPGGGVVFYVANTQQSWGQVLEVAPKTWSGGTTEPTLPWCSGGSNPTTTFRSGTKSGFGLGAKNSAIIAGACTGGAAVAARAYNGGGKSDWYLPSSAELTELYRSKSALSTTDAILDSNFFWSSTEGINWHANSLNNQIGNGAIGLIGANNKNDLVSVRPIRAFSYPTSHGGSLITGYQYSLNDGLTWSNATQTVAQVASAGNEITISGLTNGVSYTVKLRALNALGAGTASASFTAVPQVTGSGAPEGVTAIADNGKVIVNWSAPSNYEGVPITGYRITNVSTGDEATVNASTFTREFTGLSNGASYTFKVTATYESGNTDIATSTTASATPRTVPDAPTNLAVTSGVGQFALTWTAPASSGGASITDYRIEYGESGNPWATFTEAVSAATSAVVTGLTPGTQYKFRVRAINEAGEGSEVTTSEFSVTYNQAPPLTLFFQKQNATGFTFRIEMMDGATDLFDDWGGSGNPDGIQFTTSAGTVARVGKVVTVSGLSNGASADITVTTSRAAYASSTANITNSALQTGTAPVITGKTSTDSGFNFTITGYAARITEGTTFDFSATAGRVIDNGDGTVRVEGLNGGNSSTITVTALRGGYTTAATTVIGASLQPGTAPTLSAPTSIKYGFTFTINNFDGAATYTITATDNATITRNDGVVTISNLTANATATASIQVSKTGFVNASTEIVGQALPPGSDNTLFALSTTAGTLVRAGTTTEGFVSSTGIYNVSTPFETISATITATINDTDGSLAFSTDSGATWNSYTSGVATSAQNLNVGVNRFEFRVTAPNNATRVYVLTITRLPSTNPRLSALALSAGTIAPAFDTDVVNYSTTVTNANSTLGITATVAETGGSIEYSVDSGAYLPLVNAVATTGIPLHVGANTIRVRSTAPDGLTTRTYSFAIKREASLTAILTGLTPSAGTVTSFDPQTFNYSFAVGNTNSTITFTPASAAGAVTTINGIVVQPGDPSLPISLNVGANEITVVVEEYQNGAAVHATTYTFVVTRDALPSSIEVAAVPTTTSGGALFATSPTITLKNSANQILTRSSNTVTVSVSGTAALSGQTSVAAVNGVATFTNMRLVGTIGSYTLTFSVADGPSATATIVLTAGAPTKAQLVYPVAATTPLQCGGGAPCQVPNPAVGDDPYPQFSLRDVSGNFVSAAGKTLIATITSGAGGSITSGGTVLSSDAIFTFDQLRIRGSSASTYTISFGGVGIAPVSLSATVVSGSPASIVLTQAASGARSGISFVTAPQVTIYDSELIIVANSQATVTATITSGENGALIGSATATPVNGVATFTGLGIRGVAGTSYVISYSVAGLNPITQIITPTPGVATQVVLTRNASGFVNGSAFATQPILELRDGAGNTVTTDNSTQVTMTVSGDGRIIGIAQKIALAGVIDFRNVGVVGQTGVPRTLSFTATGVTAATQVITLTEGLPLTPLFGTATRTEEGFEVAITNFTPLFAWSVSATNGASTAINTSGRIIVTNLNAGQASTLTVTTQRPYFTSGTAMVSSSALAAGVEAVLVATSQSNSGFTFTVSNFAALSGFEWEIRATRGAASTAPDTSGVIEVTGLSVGESSLVTVRTWLTGSKRLAIAEFVGTASGTSAGGGATVDLVAANNLLNGKTLTAICANGSNVGEGVSGINDASSNSSFTCYTSANRRPVGYARNSIGFIAAGMELSILEGIRFVRGAGSEVNVPFTFTLQGCTTATTGCTTIITNGLTRISNLPAAGDAAARTGAPVQIRSSRPFPFYRLTFTSLVASVTNAVQIGEVIFTGRDVVNPAYAPTFGSITRSRNGFTVPITNYNNNFMWRASVPAGMTAVISPTGGTAIVRVSGVAAGASATLTVSTSRIGFTSGSANVTGSALEPARVPIFEAPVVAPNGFTVAITNYDPAFTWSINSSAGTATLTGGVVAVTNVPAATSATVTVTTTRIDYATGTAQISATSTQTGVTPTLTAVTSNTTGFTTSISNLATGYTYLVSSDFGTATLGSLGAITVSGLAPGASAVLTVTATRVGYTTTSTTLTGTASLGAALIPTIGPIISTSTGFTSTITNYDAAYNWTAVTETVGASVAISGNKITVTDLAARATAAIVLSASRAGYEPGTTEFSGVAIAPEVRSLGNQDISIIVDLSTAESSVTPQARIDIPALAAAENTQFTVRATASDQSDAGYSAVQIAATGGGSAISQVAAPLVIRFPALAADGVPSFSADGITWVRLALLQMLELPAGQDMGYFVHEDGSITILTRRIG